MELTNTEIKIVVKNMAREIVKQMSAKNAMRGAEVTAKTDDGQTVTWRTSINGTDEQIKDYFKPGKRINIGDGPRDRMVTIKSAKVLNTMTKNAPLSDMLNKENDLYRVGDDVVFRGKKRELTLGRIKAIQGDVYIISSGEGEYRLKKSELKGSFKH